MAARVPPLEPCLTKFDDQPLLTGHGAAAMSACSGVLAAQGCRPRACFLVLVLALLTIAMLGLISGGEPQAAGIARGLSSTALQIVNGETGMCLDWGPIIVNIMDCNPERGMQLWRYSNADHKIRTTDGRCLDGGGKFVHVWGCSPLLPQNQQWMYDAATGQIFFYLDTNVTCLSANMTTISQRICDVHSKEQQWRFMHVSRVEMANAVAMSASGNKTNLPYDAETY
mmetsp:Transcript_9319/g.17829  ORF Transcript_9319/g.17829 Transcript_9319/m.17829 type:complete len:227 (+) Transcript_9319:75-755(+)